VYIVDSGSKVGISGGGKLKTRKKIKSKKSSSKKPKVELFVSLT
jgi:hypothetical protein